MKIVHSAMVDAGQPWRTTIGDNLVYTDWGRDNFLVALKEVIGDDNSAGEVFKVHPYSLRLKKSSGSTYIAQKNSNYVPNDSDDLSMLGTIS